MFGRRRSRDSDIINVSLSEQLHMVRLLGGGRLLSASFALHLNIVQRCFIDVHFHLRGPFRGTVVFVVLFLLFLLERGIKKKK